MLLVLVLNDEYKRNQPFACYIISWDVSESRCESNPRGELYVPEVNLPHLQLEVSGLGNEGESVTHEDVLQLLEELQLRRGKEQIGKLDWSKIEFIWRIHVS